MTLQADDYAGHLSESQSDAAAGNENVAAGDGYAAADAAEWLQHSLLHQQRLAAGAAGAAGAVGRGPRARVGTC